MAEYFLYKREVNKSVLYDGFGIDKEYLPLFLKGTDQLQRGESRQITLLFEGKPYKAIIKNLNNPATRRVNDAYQIRYTAGGEFAQALKAVFHKTDRYILENSQVGDKGKRPRVIIPDEYKEYLAIYTTDQPNVFSCEAILVDEITALRKAAAKQSERIFEAEFNYDLTDNTAGLRENHAIVKVRKLNRKIGDRLKELYGYRCQICGQLIGERYGSRLVEAHHIDYFVKSLNNDASNQLIVCPNHHGIIHDMNPVFNRKDLTYKYPNGLVEGLKLNEHLIAENG